MKFRRETNNGPYPPPSHDDPTCKVDHQTMTCSNCGSNTITCHWNEHVHRHDCNDCGTKRLQA